MFRMLKLNPPHGWRAVGWELVVVTLGVLIALAVQQWAEQRSWRGKASVATAAIGRELAEHYRNSVEWRMVEPCIAAQIERLQQRVLNSGDRLDPAPLYAEVGSTSYVVRLPSRTYERTAWDAAISDGVTPHLDPVVRKELGAHFTMLGFVVDASLRNDIDYQSLTSLSRPLPLDPGVRYALMVRLDELRGRNELMSGMSADLIDHIGKVGMAPPSNETRQAMTEYGTYRFCRTNRLPVRSYADAMKVPN